MLKDGILVLPGYMSEEECAMWRCTYHEYETCASQKDYIGNPVLHIRDISSIERRRMLHGVAMHVTGTVASWYKQHHGVESTFLSCLRPGSVVEPHYDNVKVDGKTPNHTPMRSHSALIYMSDDFEGGEITFPRQDRVIKIQKGMLISFPSGFPYLHYVKPIKGACRYSMPVWMTQQPDKIYKFKE